jgi:hypothetical protein
MDLKSEKLLAVGLGLVLGVGLVALVIGFAGIVTTCQ